MSYNGIGNLRPIEKDNWIDITNIGDPGPVYLNTVTGAYWYGRHPPLVWAEPPRKKCAYCGCMNIDVPSVGFNCASCGAPR